MGTTFNSRVMEWNDLGNGISRMIMGYNKELMLVKVKFKQGAIGELHRHPHIQSSYIASGKFIVTIEGEQTVLNEGDSFFVDANMWHGCECIESGILIDTFAPYREEFLL